MQFVIETKSTKQLFVQTFARLFAFTALFIFLLGAGITLYQIYTVKHVYEDRLYRAVGQYKDVLLNDIALGNTNFVMQDLNAMQNELNVDAIELRQNGVVLQSQQIAHFSTPTLLVARILQAIGIMQPVAIPMVSDFGNIRAILQIHYAKSLIAWTVLPAIMSSIALFLLSLFPVSIIFFLLFRRINQSLLIPLKIFIRHLNFGEPLSIMNSGYQEHLLEMRELRLASERFADNKTKTVSALSLGLIAAQVAHDIRSPVAAILMLSKNCHSLPEEERISFREAGHRIQEIANNLIVQYRCDKSSKRETVKPCLLSAMVASIISEKNIEYKNVPLKILVDTSLDGNMVFVRVNPAQFKRVISNIINNAVEAVTADGVIKLFIQVDQGDIVMTIADNGVGMSNETVSKVMAKTHYSYGKDKGLGLGIPHAIDTIRRYGGELDITSKINSGTSITIKLPECRAPGWMCKQLLIRSGDCVVILDDDKSIHQAWDIKLRQLLVAGEIEITHFKDPKKCRHFLDARENKHQLLLLVDYELIDHSINGLDVVEHSQVDRAVLVTSHYENEEIIKKCQLLGVQLLPKMLCSEVKMQFATESASDNKQVDFSQLDAILVDDNKQYTDTVTILGGGNGEKIIAFNDAFSVIQILDRVQKQTSFYLDYDLGDGLNGGELAEVLFNRGYQELYMISGYLASDISAPYIKGYVDKSTVI